MQNVALAIWALMLSLPVSRRIHPPINIGNLRVLPQDILIVALGVALMLLLQYFLKYTREGKALKSSSARPDGSVTDGRG